MVGVPQFSLADTPSPPAPSYIYYVPVPTLLHPFPLTASSPLKSSRYYRTVYRVYLFVLPIPASKLPSAMSPLPPLPLPPTLPLPPLLAGPHKAGRNVYKTSE